MPGMDICASVPNLKMEGVIKMLYRSSYNDAYIYFHYLVRIFKVHKILHKNSLNIRKIQYQSDSDSFMT